MRDNNEVSKLEKLVDEFPVLYRQRGLSCKDTCLCWGFECGDGWYEPLHDLSEKLEGINKFLLIPNRYVCEAVQVKEKFGTLRFYYCILPVPFKIFSMVSRWFELLGKRIKNVDVRDFVFSTAWFIKQIGCGKNREEVVNLASDLIYMCVKDTENECYFVCEKCGKTLDTERNPRCITCSYVSYFCEDCAKKDDRMYYKNGELYYHGESVSEDENNDI